MNTLRSLAAALLVTSALSAQSSITTTFQSNNGGSAGWTNFFDMQWNIGVAITAFDINTSSSVGTLGTIDVYLTAPGGTYVGNQLNAGAWTLAASSAQFSAAGRNQPTSAPLTAPLVLAPGTYGIAIAYNGVSPAYTNGTGGNQTYSNAEVTLTLGSAVAGLFTGSFFDPRVWNGTIHYTPGSNFARAIPFGSGCRGSGVDLGLRGVARPVIGTQASAETNGIPVGSPAGFLLIGLNQIQPGVDLGVIGMPGCFLLVFSDGMLAYQPVAATRLHTIGVPNDATLAGVSVHLQSVAADPGGNTLGFVTSNGLTWILDRQ